MPLLLTDLQIDETFHIDADARFEKLTDDNLRAMFVDSDLSGIPHPLALAAKHALVQGTPIHSLLFNLSPKRLRTLRCISTPCHSRAINGGAHGTLQAARDRESRSEPRTRP